jgi:hypothetical protein
MRGWEYHVLIVSDEWLTENGGGDANDALDRLGEDGWEVSAVVPPAGQVPRTVLILKRPRSN